MTNVIRVEVDMNKLVIFTVQIPKWLKMLRTLFPENILVYSDNADYMYI